MQKRLYIVDLIRILIIASIIALHTKLHFFSSAITSKEVSDSLILNNFFFIFKYFAWGGIGIILISSFLYFYNIKKNKKKLTIIIISGFFIVNILSYIYQGSYTFYWSIYEFLCIYLLFLYFSTLIKPRYSLLIGILLYFSKEIILFTNFKENLPYFFYSFCGTGKPTTLWPIFPYIGLPFISKYITHFFITKKYSLNSFYPKKDIPILFFLLIMFISTINTYQDYKATYLLECLLEKQGVIPITYFLFFIVYLIRVEFIIQNNIRYRKIFKSNIISQSVWNKHFGIVYLSSILFLYLIDITVDLNRDNFYLYDYVYTFLLLGPDFVVYFYSKIRQLVSSKKDT